MKTLIKTVTTVSLFAVSGLVMADQCPDSLNAEEMYDCIVVDGAGGTYKKETVTVEPETVKAVEPADKPSKQQATAPLENSQL